MKLSNVSSKQQFLNLLVEEISRRDSGDSSAEVVRFAEQYWRLAPLEEIRQRRLSDLYGVVRASWQFLQLHPEGQPRVAVFNPELEVHGWQSTHTVVAILQDNMPFLLDSVRMALARLKCRVYAIQSSVLHVRRDRRGRLEALLDRDSEAAREAGARSESLIFVEVDRHGEEEDRQQISAEIERVLSEVSVAVTDYPQMKQQAAQAAAAMTAVAQIDSDQVEEIQAFFEWLSRDHFTFLGYVFYEVKRRARKVSMHRVAKTALGILRQGAQSPETIKVFDLPVRVRKRLETSDPVLFAKSASRARVHRPVYPDYVALRVFNEQGEVIGEHRFLGLYTALAYREGPQRIPLLRTKVAEVQKLAGFDPEDHAGRELDQVLSLYPRDELFQVDARQLHDTVLSILYIQERHLIRLFVREDVYGEFVYALVFVPREIYSTHLRLKIIDILSEATGATDVDFVTHFSESALARTQFTLKVPIDGRRRLDAAELESLVVAAAQSWSDGLMESLGESQGEEAANYLFARYAESFPTAYQERFSPRRAVADISHMEELQAVGDISMSFYRALEEPETLLHFKLFHAGAQVPLSDVLPLFENLGLKVLGEHPYNIQQQGGLCIWVYDFALESAEGIVMDIPTLRDEFETLFRKVWAGEAENDAFNRLAIVAQMGWRDIAVLRSYARYMRQIRFSYSQDFIAATLVAHQSIAVLLKDLFSARFNPACVSSPAQCEAAQKKLEIEINEALENVANLSEDRVLRRYVELIRATLRTNYFQLGQNGEPKSYIALKLSPRAISEMPLPLPMYEIFVYSPRVEGVHLRGGKVARGGLRWSDRYEDYRTEVLGLVKAQQVKNSIIVPVGAKGGFVAKRLPDGDREAFMAEGIESYKTFIRGLLDITDNLRGNEVLPPAQVLRHDEDDTYLVVAADKGTATFSDIANDISEEYSFWLGDAFASGGSQGYDHKKMGITARGAWVSVERHFRELNLNTATDDHTVVGIGDMSGDVFGNGLLQSAHSLLVAAFNHLHIFIDPQPDRERAFAERQRLFALPRSSWADYDSQLISEGGGIFPRSQKSIPISPQMQALFGISQDRLPPNMLISAILKAQVDLLWFGGIGSYVKSRRESHADVGDKANDALRVDGAELKARVVGEGGNLGMTQLGRIEYAMAGGRLNTDFIDNAGGVDCSDHEVNIKILLNEIVENGDLTLKQRNRLLADMTDDIARLVLRNNYKQTLALSNATFEAAQRIEEYRRLINHLESIGRLDRSLEFIPDDDTITERKSRRQGLARPELCVLISYVKGQLKETLMESAVVDDPALAAELLTEFPQVLSDRFAEALAAHRLRREIIATQVANDLVNHMGIAFCDRLRQSSGASLPAIARAYVVTRDVYQMNQIWSQIEALDYQVPAGVQHDMMADIMRLVRRATRWFLRNRRREVLVREDMGRFAEGISWISTHLDQLVVGPPQVSLQAAQARYQEAGVPEALARAVAGCPYLYSALGIIEAQQQTTQSLAFVAEGFFRVGELLDLHWFNQQLNAAQPLTHWQALARESFREDLDWQQRAITVGILRNQRKGESLEPILERWLAQHAPLVNRWQLMLTELKATKDPEFPMYSVAMRELLDIAQATQHSDLLIDSSA